MHKRTSISALAIFCVLALLVMTTGCAPTPIAPQPRPLGSIAVAAFTAPKHNWELLAGYLPDEGKGVKQEILTRLDDSLNQTLRSHGVKVASSAVATRQCQEIVVFERAGKSRESAWAYWHSVGKCLPADFVLVPQVLRWKELEGGGNPASVILDLYLIDVKAERMVARFHYDETQKALSDNLFDMGKFMRRKGEWVEAEVLAKEGIEAGLREMGL